MFRKAFLMTLKPGYHDEYVRRHNPIWPDLQEILKGHGVHNYSIFLEHDSNRLFAYVEVESEERWRQNRRNGDLSSVVGIHEGLDVDEC